jgi:hypothetical protein
MGMVVAYSPSLQLQCLAQAPSVSKSDFPGMVAASDWDAVMEFMREAGPLLHTTSASDPALLVAALTDAATFLP